MGLLRPGDNAIHYSDNSHRWIAPPGVDQCAWDAGMRAHKFLHLASMGGPVEETGPPVPARVSTSRTRRRPHRPHT